MRISDWSSDVCSSDLTSASTPYTRRPVAPFGACRQATSSTSASAAKAMRWKMHSGHGCRFHWNCEKIAKPTSATHAAKPARHWLRKDQREGFRRSEEHTSELQSLMRSSYAVFCS